MTTVEEKLDKLADDVLKIGVEQVKGFSKLDHLNSWSITADKTTTKLRESISDLAHDGVGGHVHQGSTEGPAARERGTSQRPRRSHQSAGLGIQGEDPGFHPAQGYVTLP
jgi:hypothetical protein